ncbi:hypothetical protein GCM10010112_36760 [Actinoplanes lobatus]|uniref:Putative transposase YdaD n=1 Tax=Actinoplanes lobatus TaxID=113568 RepID=A0A7W7HCY3_9ACTN|nr:hypothetical protein [Actinoplanes lobatus]MBB4748239.1 putative transposase YdaD [Actinoplanes lobatus]GGN70336.1 hypothetical protein GCM10010112_36760 [Actinoplanes lobatus]GIE40088.1 hypothetical protein Alo02nite_29860 [Actinoplanes lobatus]
MNTDPALFGHMIGIDMPPAAQPGATELNLAAVHADRRNADLVLTGHDRVVHLEFQRRADPTMADRMLIYRSLLRVEPACASKRIQQHVIVLDRGTSPSRIDEPGLTFAFDTHYARDIDPVRALADPLTAPWATLASAPNDDVRRARLVTVLGMVASTGSENLSRDLIRTALTFAAITMRREDIKEALKEAAMPADMIRDTEFAQELIDEGRAAGRAEVLREAIQDHIVRVLMHRKFGARIALQIADALITQDQPTSVERAAFADVDELMALAAEK